MAKRRTLKTRKDYEGVLPEVLNVAEMTPKKTVKVLGTLRDQWRL